MTVYGTTLPVRVRIGERPEWTFGEVPADHSGRVQPERLAELLIAVGEHMQVLIEHELQRTGHASDDGSGNDSH
mgnify:CR=1 FL=1